DAERSNILKNENESKAVSAQLMAAREKGDELRRRQELHNRELAAAQRARHQAEEEVRELEYQLQLQRNAVRENAKLRQQLRFQENIHRQPPTKEEVVRQ
ncbi:unnamed protein product, partial [Prorocentrum cordatum]